MPLSVAEAPDESGTIRAAAAGDAESFAELFRRYYPMMLAYAYRLCLREADAEDVTQETFIRAARGLAGYRPEAPLRHWLYQICTNVVRDWARRADRRRRLEEAVAESARIDEQARDADHALAREALGQLPEDQRSAVVLVYFEGLKHAEAARILNCAEATVSWRIFVAKRQLKEFFRRHA